MIARSTTPIGHTEISPQFDTPRSAVTGTCFLKGEELDLTKAQFDGDENFGDPTGAAFLDPF